MSLNVMNEYIRITQKHMGQYMRLILGGKFNRAIFDEYLRSYVNVRYYDLNEMKSNNTLKKDILQQLEFRRDKLIESDYDNKEIIENMYEFYKYILYFDKVVPNKDLDITVQQIENLREGLLGKKEEDFKERLYKLMYENIHEIEEFFAKFETPEFSIKLTNYNEIANVQRVNIRYCIKIPALYSNFAVEKAFTTGTTNEDRLFVEYYLITIQIIKDIIRGNFKKQYIVEFAGTLFKKSQKILRLLEIINNSAVQDKLNIKIKYADFIENREYIYDLMRQGYRIAIVLDDTYNLEPTKMEELNMFKYILLNHHLDYFDEFMKNKWRVKNIIET